jgi:hypothetical protein
MPIAATCNDTASTATSKAFDGIVKNLNEIAGKSPNLRALIAPSEKVITDTNPAY